MMLKVVSLTALVLGLSGGVALADHGRGGDHRSQSRAIIRDHHERRGGGGNVVRDHRGWDRGGRMIVRNEPRYHRYDRRPIYVSRPIIRERYHNYYRRPAVIAESYNPMAGYYWVAGGWAWDGYEWIWQPGHYEPDPSYVDQGYEY